MPAVRLTAGLAIVIAVSGAFPAWAADAPIPPPPTIDDRGKQAPPQADAAPPPAQAVAPGDNSASQPPAPVRQDASRPDASGQDSSKQDSSKQDSSKQDSSTPDAPKQATPDQKPAQQQASRPPDAPKPLDAPKPDGNTPAASTVAKPPSVTVIDAFDAHGILGRDVRSPANENMGRIADVIVDRAGQVRAVVIDFGGFLGVGSRKIVVEWNALHFWNVADKTASITLDLTREQVRAAPEYKDDAPIVVLGASGTLHPLRFPPVTMQER